MFLELDTTQRLGPTTVVWVIDYPSDPRLPRWRESPARGRGHRGLVRPEHGPRRASAM
jgi:hypothetical protein